MPEITIRGSVQPFLQDESFDFDPTRGYIHRFNFKGASQSQMLAQQGLYVSAGIACRLTFHQGGTATLDVEDSTQVYTLDAWEIDGSGEQVDLFSHPTMLSLIGDGDIAQLREDLDNHVSVADVKSGLITGGYSAASATIIARFYSLYLRGTDAFLVGNYVLKHTTNAPNRWSGNISDVGVEAIYTKAQLLAEVTSAALWAYPMPGRLQDKVNAIPEIGTRSFYQWGWLKGASTESTTANNRINITTTYTHAQWSTDIYPLYVPAP